MSEEETIVQLLKSLGLTGNESRIYLSLLRRNPATGYEISQMANVPRSAIYSVLSKLESMNIINSVGDRPRRFIPIPPEALINHFSHKIERDLSELKTLLVAYNPNMAEHDVWYIKGYENMVFKAKETVHDSKARLYFSIWPREFSVLEKELLSAIERGVEVTLFSFCRLPEINAHVVSYDLDEERLRQAWKSSIILVADNQTAIMGGAEDDLGNQVVWTNHPSLVGLATNHIILDITLAGNRLERDVTDIVAPMMAGLKIDLDGLIEEAHPHRH
ncbi:MAG: TrmB family transcriptional regulator [Candidatus Neomarinimicrobiota bacterium]